ncbi:fimbria/pilus outer membrane usher protein [Sphingopyxis terrae]|jgi:outer membrane usher protein|uniref:fimbria/pilus outer membrane usher protein n=1 Tax=Sphingopyxis terrae TaxID=33052 RepID=UPI003F809E6C
MRMRAALCSVALPALWASTAAAQVSIPLPQRPGTAQPTPAPAPTPAPGTPPTSIPLPGTPTPTPAPTPTEPDLGMPQVPMGPYGRPDINPYDRDIEMTVPLTFLSRSLGDIPMRLTADDRFLLDTETFLKLLKPILNDEAHAKLAAHLAGKTQFGPDDLAETGVALTYDPSTLAVVVVQVSADQRSTVDLFAPPKDDMDDISLQPAGFSAYLNLNLIQSYLWEGSNNTDPPTINFDGAVRVGDFVFEGDAQFGQQISLSGGDSYKFHRNYARLVYDQPEDYRRWFIGDLDPEIRGQQAYVQMGGVGVLRQQRRFNAFRSAILQANRQLILQRESTVRFLRNGSLYRELRLQPGRYDFSSLPLVAGSNDIQIQVTDNTGAVQDLSYQQYLDPIDLDPGDYEYGAFLGPTSRNFGYAPDYKGPVAFTGFFRKAFVNAPAIGVGLQASKDVQTLTGQTQFVLGNGGRLLLDAAGSHSKDAGTGFAAGVSYEHFFDRGGLSDSMTLRVDYTSPHFATLGNLLGINTTSVTASAQYTHQFSQKFLTTSTASYIKGRGTLGDSYRIGTTGYYRFDREWTFRTGVEYAKYPASFSRNNGFSVIVGLVFQPDYRRRAEARYESRDNLAELSYNQSGLNQLNSVGFGGILTRQDNSAQAAGYATYTANRFDAAISHAAFGPNISNFANVNVTTLRVGTTLAYADGMFGIGRRINDSFMLLKAHENLGKRDVVVGQSLAQNDYIARSGPLGAAVHNFLGSYTTQSVQYDVQDPPPGYDTGPGVFRVHPPYKSGYAARIGTDAFASAIGTLMLTPEKPVSLIGGRVTLLDVKEGDNPQPTPFFTNSVGRFAVSNLLPGRRYLVETYGLNGTVDRAFEFTVPADTTGLVDLGTVKSGSFK